MQNVVKYTSLVGIILLLVGVALIGCTPDTSAPTLVPRATTALIPDDSTPVSVDLAVVDRTPVVPEFTDTECLACHTDQSQLTALAVPEEHAGEALSSGPG